MLNSGKKFRALRDKKKIINLVLSEKKMSERKKKTYPPQQVKWSVPNIKKNSANTDLHFPCTGA